MNSTNDGERKSNLGRDLLIGLIVTIVGGVVVAYLIQDARFRPPEPPIVQTPQIPTQSLLFEEDFEDEKAQLFIPNNGGTWKFINEGTGNIVYQVDNATGNGYPDLTFGSYEWSDYAIQYRIKILSANGIANILHFRESEDHLNGYVLGLLFDSNEFVMAYKLNGAGWERLETKPFNYDMDKWYTIYISAEGEHILAYIDNYLMAKVDDSRFRAGALSWSVGPGTIAQFDDIRIYNLRK